MDKIEIPKRLFDILTSDMAYNITRYADKCPTGFDDILDESDISTYDVFSAIKELQKIRKGE